MQVPGEALLEDAAMEVHPFDLEGARILTCISAAYDARFECIRCQSTFKDNSVGSGWRFGGWASSRETGAEDREYAS